MTPRGRLGIVEFVALMAMLYATVAFSLDAMLPALPEIAAALTPADPNRAQLIITAFVAGLGVGMVVAGPLSDSLGRRPVVALGAGVFVLGAGAAAFSESLEGLLIARFVQGIGGAGPRTVVMAIIRDLYRGREMARIVAFVITVFAIVPAAAPLVGAWIMGLFGWRAIFGAFVIFLSASTAWLFLRQGETLPAEARRPLRPDALAQGARMVAAERQVRLSIAAQVMAYVCLFGALASSQPIFDVTFGRAEAFPAWFALIGILGAGGALANARLVMRHGMRRVAFWAFAAQAAITGALALAWLAGLWPGGLAFGIHVVWTVGIFATAGLTIGNLNALAMEPLGHVACMAASIIGAVSTVAGALLAAPLGLAFDGTPLPLATGVALAAAIGAWMVGQLVDDAPAPRVAPGPGL